jgi:hypothetical protein
MRITITTAGQGIYFPLLAIPLQEKTVEFLGQQSK